MPKVEISWKDRNEDGVRRELNVRKSGDQWQFYIREKRYDQWEYFADPSLDDWLKLLDGIQRRISRRLLKPEEEKRVKRTILARHPGTVL